MKLIVIYGPPAVGKLKVAEALSKKTKFKIFHNHLTADLVSAIFDFGTKEYSDLTAEIRLGLIKKCIKTGLDLIFTFTYGIETYQGKEDNLFLQQVKKIVDQSDGVIYFIRLYCSKEEQHKRLQEKSRKKFNKLTDPKVLAEIEKSYRLNQKIDLKPSFSLDVTNLTPNKAALKILRFIDN